MNHQVNRAEPRPSPDGVSFYGAIQFFSIEQVVGAKELSDTTIIVQGKVCPSTIFPKISEFDRLTNKKSRTHVGSLARIVVSTHKMRNRKAGYFHPFVTGRAT